MAQPRPREAPVTKATLPASENTLLLPALVFCFDPQPMRFDQALGNRRGY
jgi:hypothetical protein